MNPENAYDEFMLTKHLHAKTNGRYFYHYCQSFSPEEKVTPKTVHEIGIRLTKECFDGHEVIVGTHIEKNHLHGEVVGFGILILLLVDENEEMFKTMFDFNRSISLPTCLKDIEMSESDLDKLVPMVCAMKDIDHNPYKITEEMVLKAFKKLEEYNKNN